MMRAVLCAAGAFTVCLSAPALAQQATSEPSVFDGDYLAVGIGAAYGPSYDGSDDYQLFPIPVVQGSFKGIGIDPRPGGIALDFIPDPPSAPGLNLGIAASVRLDRTRSTHDPVVDKLGRLSTAVEVGPTVGVTFPHVLNPYGKLTLGTDVTWDVGGAHGGMVVDSQVSYSTPLSRGIYSALSLTAEYGDRKFTDYYYSVTPAGSAASGLPVFRASGGFTKMGAVALFGFDLDGNFADGGAAVFIGGGYSRMLGDARRSPLTSVRGNPNQWLGGIGVGYIF